MTGSQEANLNGVLVKRIATVVIATMIIGVVGQSLLLWRWQGIAKVQIESLISEVQDIKRLLGGSSNPRGF